MGLWVLLISPVSPAPTTYCHSLEKLLIWLLSVHTLSTAAIHFKDTWKSTHITLWPHFTTTLFDVTLPKDINAVEQKQHIFLLGRESYGRMKNNNKMHLINLVLPTQRLFVLCCWPCLSLMKRSDRKHMLEKAAKCCLITLAAQKLYIRMTVLLQSHTNAFFISLSPLFVFP